MRQLPHAGYPQHGHLEESPPHNTGVCRLRLVAEFCLALLCDILAPSPLNTSLIRKKKKKVENARLHTRWYSCSLLISISLPLRSLTFWTKSVIFPWSSVWISDVVPMARSRVNLTPPRLWPPSHPLCPVECDGVKQILWSPESAEVKVILPVDWPREETIRWSLSKTS